MRKAKHHTHAKAAAPPTEESLLSPQRAFVVHFREAAGGEPGPFAGRVEHIASGQAAHFHSVDELVAVIKRLLADVGR